MRDRFQDLIRHHRRRKYQMQIRRADRLRGQQAYELRLAAQQDLQQDNGMEQQAMTGVL